MILEYLAQDALARARIVASPVSTGHASVSLGMEEHASFSTQAAWACEQMVELAPVVLGCELLTAVRAIRMGRCRLPVGPLQDVFERCATVLGDDRRDRPLTDDLAAAARLVEQGL